MKRCSIFAVLCILGAALSADYVFMNIDGIRLTIEGIELGNGGIDDFVNVASISVNSTIDLVSDDLSNAFNQDLEVTFFDEEAVTQDISTIQIFTAGGSAVKAYAYIESQGHFVYTSQSGIETRVSADGSDWAEPTDYDYLAYDYVYFPRDGGRAVETTFLPESINILELESIELSLLVDTYKTVYYWDGSEASRLGFVATEHLNDPTAFPGGTAVVGLTYLPLYVAINRDLEVETYVVAQDNSSNDPNTALSGAVADEFSPDEVMFMTLTFDRGSGEFYVGRTSNWDDFNGSYGWRFSQLVRRGEINGSDYDLALTNDFSAMPDSSAFDSISGFTRINVGDESEAVFGDQSESQSYPFDYVRVR